MKIEVIKSQEEVKWNFPCKGKRKSDGMIVGFKDFGEGTVLESEAKSSLFNYSKYWDMSEFEPIVEKGNNPDWGNPKFPILAKITDGEVLMIKGLGDIDNSVNLTAFNTQYLDICDNRASFESKEKRAEWLQSLEILPKGTEIKITI